MDDVDARSQLLPVGRTIGGRILWIVSVALVYFVTARLSLRLEIHPENIAAVWPPAGIFLSAILLTRRDSRVWLAASLFVADFAAEVLGGTPPVVGALYATALAGDAILGAWLIRRFAGEAITFTKVREVVVFLACSVIASNGVTSLVAAGAAQLIPGAGSFWGSWAWWATSDGIGNLIATPFILSWASWAVAGRVQWKPGRVLEGGILLGSLALLNTVVCGYLATAELFSLLLPWVTLPFLVWAAIRFGVRGVSSALVVLAAVVVSFAATGRFAGTPGMPSALDAVTVVQASLAIVAVPSLFLVSLVAEGRGTEEALKERNRYIETILENAPIGFAVNTIRDSFGFFVSGRFEEIYGVPRGSLTSVNHFFEQVYVDPVLREQMRTRVMADMASGDPARMRWEDIPVTTAEGERKYVTAINIPLIDQGMMVSTVQDVTAQHLAEEARQQSEMRFRAVVEQAGDGFELIDSQGRYVDANGSTCRQLGYSKEELLGLTICDVDPLLTPEQFATQFQSLVGAVPVTFESMHRRKDGTLIPVEVTASVISHGQALWGVSFARDISERRQAQAEQQRLQEQLIQVQKIEAIGRLAGGVAHDFNNILTAMMMHLGLLQDSGDLAPEVRAGLTDLEAEANRAADLTRQLLMFSRRQVLQTRAFDLNSLLGNLLRMLRRLIGEQVVLELTGEGSDLWIDADPGMIEQVVTNLVVNARDAMPDGGRVTLTTRSVVFDERVGSRDPEARPGAFVCLTVSDTGEGMDEATRQRIFEPFFTTKATGKGTGLGLATVHGIIKQHKGWVTVESALGAGTSFRVYLPAGSGSPKVASDIDGERRFPRGTETILLVEDAEPVRRATAAILRQLGYRVVEAGNAQEALVLWPKERADVALLLTDMVMPGELSGQDLAIRLQRDEPALKCLLVSGYSQELSQRGIASRQEISFLAKPFEPAVLASRVRACLDGR